MERTSLCTPFGAESATWNQLFYIRERTKEEEWLDLAQQHYHTIQRFGRFPERNPVLGRELTPEEAEFLKKPSSGNA